MGEERAAVQRVAGRNAERLEADGRVQLIQPNAQGTNEPSSSCSARQLRRGLTPSLDPDTPQRYGNTSSRFSWLRPHSTVVGPCHKKGAFCLGLGSRRLPLPCFFLGEFAQEAVLHELEHVWL